MHSLWQTISHTPLWVIILFIYLLRVGFRATQPHAVELKKTLIMPLIFTALSLHTLTTSFALTGTTVVAWSIAIVVGSLGGYWYASCLKITTDKSQQILYMPGSWSSLILILLIFSSKYYIGYQLATYPQPATQLSFALPMLTLSGVCTGLFIGRVLRYLQLIYC